MSLYIATTEDGFLADQTKAKIAKEITRTHTGIMKVPESLVRVIFLSYQKGSGYTGGKRASTAALNCILRSGHSLDEKEALLKQLWAMFEKLTGIGADQLAISLLEIHSSNAMEMGKVMPDVGYEHQLGT